MHWMIDGYHHRTVFPRLKKQSLNVDDAGATVIDPAGVFGPKASRPLWIELTNVDSNPVTVLFKQFSSATEWMRVTLTTGTNLIIPGWDTKALGLEVFASAAITDNGFNITTAFPDGTSP